MSPEQIAEIAHEANRVLQRHQGALGVPVAEPWSGFDAVERSQVVLGVLRAQEGATPEEMHDAWVQEKVGSGWIYGVVKDAEDKTHPNLVPYRDLPEDQRRKDDLFLAIVGALS